jgi:outer membrane receptor protein involved in Fe transport
VGEDWYAMLYGQLYDWSMSSNPTYDFQINQFDERWTIGGKAEKMLIDTAKLQLALGGELRFDDVNSVGLEHYNEGRFVAKISDNELEQGSVGMYLDAVWRVNGKLRLMGGLRYDQYDFDVSARNSSSFAGSETASRASPKFGFAYAMLDELEIYGNWGKGFHSNDARGVVNTADPVPGLSPGKGFEFGTRVGYGDFKMTAAYWWLDQDSELIFIGDSNSVEPKGGSEREGFEFTMFWQARAWLAIDAVATRSKARFIDSSEGSWVEGAVEKSGQLGVTLTWQNWDASMRLRYLGPYALLADNSQRADSLTTVNLRAARHWDSLTLFAEVINLFATQGKEIVYYYPAFVAGLDPSNLSSETIDCDTLNCRMSRATEPRAFRAGISYKF